MFKDQKKSGNISISMIYKLKSLLKIPASFLAKLNKLILKVK